MSEKMTGEAEVTAYMKVLRQRSGRYQYFRVSDGVTVEIDEATYLAEHETEEE